MAPRLRPHVQITRQHYRGRRWHVAHDPASNQFYRLNPIAHEMVALLDGKRTVEDVWNDALSRHADNAPTQGEVIELLSQLYNSNLLAVDATPEIDQLLRRGRDRVKKKVQGQLIGLMYLKMKLFNPDRYLSWVEPILRPAINLWGFLVWAAFVLTAVVLLLPHAGALRDGVESTIAPANWGWLFLMFVVTKVVHETGHGVICKRYKGQVPEFGFMLLVLVPSPYVDASSCWAFPSKWRRIAVGAGGMIFELFLAAAASFVWRATTDGQLVHQLAYNVMFMSSVSTILFNANPLMRFDGYYILSDLLETPNLMQRSMNMVKFLFQKHVYRLRQARSPSTHRTESIILVTYGVLALAYRVFLFVGITLYLMGKLFALGVILAAWTAAAWFLLPVGKFLHWHATSPMLSESRGRAILRTVAMGVALFIVFGLIPFPDHRRAQGVIESESRSGVFAGAEGFVDAAHVRPGEWVERGHLLLSCRSPDLEAELENARAELDGFIALERDLTARSPAAAEIARSRIAAQEQLIALLETRRALLDIRAPHDGVVIAPPLESYIGSYLRRGDFLLEVVDTTRVRVVASLGSAQRAPLADLESAEGGRGYTAAVRLRSDPWTVLPCRIERIEPAGQKRLPHAGLGVAGGGTVEVTPDDREGTATRRSQFYAYLVPDRAWAPSPGERVAIRFMLPDRPLLHQWVDRLRGMMQGRKNV